MKIKMLFKWYSWYDYQ